MPAPYQVIPITGLPMVQAGDNLCDLIVDALGAQAEQLCEQDIVCVAQKVVSKAEGQLIALADVEPSNDAIELAAETDKDPRLVELILQESTEVLRKKPGVLIVRHRLGLVGAHAGIDQSNVEHDGGEHALLLPKDPDHSAAALQASLAQRTGCQAGVIITDSHNRPWRLGTIGAAIGAAGVHVLEDRRGGEDVFGRELKVTLINHADAIAAAATLVMGETTEKIPLVIIRGLQLPQADNQSAKMINRPLAEDMFR